MEIVVRPRQAGKTTEALRWLLDGHPVDDWPGWSRVIVAADKVRAWAIVRQGREADQELRGRGLPAGLSRVVLTPEDWPVRGIEPGRIEWALEDVDALIARRFGSLPAVATINGVAR